MLPLVPAWLAGPGKLLSIGVFHLVTQLAAMMSRQRAALNTSRCFVSFRHEPKFEFRTRWLNTDEQGEGVGASFGAGRRCWWRPHLKISSSDPS